MTIRPHTEDRDGEDGEVSESAMAVTVEDVPAAVGSSQVSDNFTDEQGVANAPPDKGNFGPTEITPSSEDIELDVEIETSKPRIAPSPYAPSRQERAEHNIAHCPFRSWCAHCVAGKCKSTPHSMGPGDKDQASIPNVGVDYAFMSDKGDQAGLEIGEVKILAIKDDKSKYTFAVPVPKKVWRTKNGLFASSFNVYNFLDI